MPQTMIDLPEAWNSADLQKTHGNVGDMIILPHFFSSYAARNHKMRKYAFGILVEIIMVWSG